MSGEQPGAPVAMVFVLRDCLLPRQTQIPANVGVPIFFASAVSTRVVVQVPTLSIVERLPDPTAVVEVRVEAQPGEYKISADMDLGATHVEGTLNAVKNLQVVVPTSIPSSPAVLATREAPDTSPEFGTPMPTSSDLPEPTTEGVGCDPSYPDFCIPPPPPRSRLSRYPLLALYRPAA